MKNKVLKVKYKRPEYKDISLIAKAIEEGNRTFERTKDRKFSYSELDRLYKELNINPGDWGYITDRYSEFIEQERPEIAAGDRGELYREILKELDKSYEEVESVRKRSANPLYLSAPNDIPLSKAMEICHFSENVDDAYLMTENQAHSTISMLKSKGESGEYIIEDVSPVSLADVSLEETVTDKEETISVFTEMLSKAQSGDASEIASVRDWYNSVSQKIKDDFILFQLDEFQSDMATMGRNEETGEQWTLAEVKEQFEYLISSEADMTALYKESKEGMFVVTDGEGNYIVRVELANPEIVTSKNIEDAYRASWAEAKNILQAADNIEEGVWEIVEYKKEAIEVESHKAEAFTEEEFKFIKLTMEHASPRDVIGSNEGFENSSVNRALINSIIDKANTYIKEK